MKAARIFTLLLAGVIATVITVACVPGKEVKKIETLSLDEMAIVKVFDSQVAAWNNGDKQGVLNTYDDKAEIMVGLDREIVNKRDYAKSSKGLNCDKYKIKRGKIKNIEITEDKAQAVVVLYVYAERTVMLYTKNDLIRVGTEWKIKKRTYTHTY